MSHTHLSQELRTLLTDILEKRAPELLPVVDSLGVVPLAEETRERLRDEIVADELISTGFNQDDTINARGSRLEELIGVLTRL